MTLAALKPVLPQQDGHSSNKADTGRGRVHAAVIRQMLQERGGCERGAVLTVWICEASEALSLEASSLELLSLKRLGWKEPSAQLHVDTSADLNLLSSSAFYL